MGKRIQNKNLMSYLSFEKAITIFAILTIAIIPLLSYQGVNYMTELPKMVGLFLLAPLLFFMLHCLPEDRRRPAGYFGLALCAYLGWLLINSLFSLDPVVSFLGFYGNFTGFFFYLFSLGFFFVGFYYQDQKMKFIIPLIIAATFIAGQSISQFYTGGLDRAMGTQGHPINLANYLILIIPCCLGLLISDKPLRRWGRFLLLICLYVMVLAQILTFSRAGWIGLAVFFILFLFTLGKKQSSEHLPILLIIAGIILFAVFSAYFMVQLQPSRATLHSYRLQIMTELSDVSRHYFSVAAWKVFAQYPFGAGLSTFYFTATPYLSPVLREQAIYSYPHNDFLNTLATQGIIGGLFYLTLVILLIRMWWTWRNGPARETLTAALWAGVFAHLLMIQSNFPAYGYTYLFWFFIGFLNIPAALKTKPFQALENMKTTWYIQPIYQKLFWALIFFAAIYYSNCYFQADAAFLQGTVAAQNGQLETAGKFFARSVQLAPWVEQYKFNKLANDCQLYQSPKTPEQTKRTVFQTIKQEMLILNALNPLNHRNKVAIGNALLTLKAYQQSIDFFKQAARLYPNFPDYYDRIGYALIQLSRDREAQQYFQKSLLLNPDNQYARHCLNLLQKATAR